MFKLNKLKDDFYKHDQNTSVDLQEALAARWSSFSNDGEGKSYFSINPNMAAWILHNTKFEQVPEKKYGNVFHVARTFSGEGIKGMLPKQPIIIDTVSNTIIQGRTRLLGLAMASKGSYLWIELV